MKEVIAAYSFSWDKTESNDSYFKAADVQSKCNRVK